MENRFLRFIANNKKGQGLLETAVAVVVIILFLGGVMNIWFWGNKQLVQRQQRYNATRVTAGTSDDNYKLQWPVYTPEELGEDRVLVGKP